MRRSLIVLKALTFAPDRRDRGRGRRRRLPEQIGGPRNWDYRYCWLRDAALTLQALAGAGFIAEAGALAGLAAARGRRRPGRPADHVRARPAPAGCPSWSCDWLSGYEGSAPVRIGNAAAEQLQLDVWGEILDGLHLAREAGLSSNDDAWDAADRLLEFLEGHWQRPGQRAVGDARRPRSTSCTPR